MSSIPIRSAEEHAGASPNAQRTTIQPPLLISANEAARLIGVSRATWWAHHASGLCPLPVKLQGRTLWRAAELRAWVNADCPPRTRWQWQPARA